MSRHIPSILALASVFVVASSLPARATGSVGAPQRFGRLGG